MDAAERVPGGNVPVSGGGSADDVIRPVLDKNAVAGTTTDSEANGFEVQLD